MFDLLLFDQLVLLHLSLVEGLKVLQELKMKLLCRRKRRLSCKKVLLEC